MFCAFIHSVSSTNHKELPKTISAFPESVLPFSPISNHVFARARFNFNVKCKYGTGAEMENAGK